MKTPSFKNLVLAAALSAACSLSVRAQNLYITEVDPSGSGNNAYAADWFELTNTSSTIINLTGWKMDDNSNSFSSAVALRGVTNINPGQSIVFFEGTSNGSTDTSIANAFNAAWGTSLTFGASIGAYGGSGVGLSTSGDAVNIYNASGVLQANVSFGSSSDGVTFDNSAKLNNTTISQLSVAGVKGAFVSSIGETGSPAAIPEPSTYALMIGLGAMGIAVLRRTRTRVA